jgi:oligopeptide/dipeptide ABC transporter ATP-binding protein
VSALLEVRDLIIEYNSVQGCLPALNGVTFELRSGEILGVLGESGAGKTTLGLAALRLLPANARLVAGSVRFRGRDLWTLDDREMQNLRGSEISMISQEPDQALNPFMRARVQVEEVIRAHRPWNRGRRREEATRVLSALGICRDSRLAWAYPHQLSGGERQRLVIAQAIACGPALLIADEPTVSLDVILQAEWLALVKELCERLSLAVLVITHDPAILAGFADRVLVMYRGEIVEAGTLEQVLGQPLHPYTQALLQAVPPPPGMARSSHRLPVIPAPPAESIPGDTGCPFEPRCPDRLAACSERHPGEAVIQDGRHVRCVKYVE